MDEACHSVKQEIESITIWNGNQGLVEFGASEAEAYRVGYDGVTRIEACFKPGLHANLPYVRVWKGDVAVGEFCQHNIVGLYFKEPEPASPTFTAYSGEADPDCPKKAEHVDNKECPHCWIPF